MRSRNSFTNKHVAFLFAFCLLISDIVAAAGTDGRFVHLADELTTKRMLSKSKSSKQSKSGKSDSIKSSKTTAIVKGSSSKVSSKSSKSSSVDMAKTTNSGKDTYYEIVTTKSWSYKVPKDKVPNTITQQQAAKESKQSSKSSKSQVKASKAKSSKSRSGWSYVTTKSPKSKVASKDPKSSSNKSSKSNSNAKTEAKTTSSSKSIKSPKSILSTVSKSKSTKSTKSSSTVSNDELKSSKSTKSAKSYSAVSNDELKSSKSTKSTKSSSTVSNDEQNSSKSTKSMKSSAKSSKSIKSHSKSPKLSSKSAKSPKSTPTNSSSSSSKSHKKSKAPNQTSPPSKSPTTETPIEYDSKSPKVTLAPSQSPTEGNTQVQTNLNMEQGPQFFIQCQEPTINDKSIRFDVGYEVDIDRNVFALNSQHTTSAVLLILLDNMESAILSHLSLSSGCPLLQMQLRRAAVRRLALVGIQFMDNRQMVANSCTPATSTTPTTDDTSTTCNVKAINEMEIIVDSEQDTTTVCTILEEIQKFFSNYKAGDVEFVQSVSFTGSNYNEQSCSPSVNNSEGVDPTRNKSLFIGWMIAIPLLVLIAIIFCINLMRSRYETESTGGEVDEENRNLNKDVGYHHDDTDSDASTVQHHVYSPVDVQKCLSGNCMSCSDCDTKDPIVTSGVKSQVCGGFD